MPDPAHRRTVRGFLAALALVFPALALDPTLRVSQYHKQYWQVEQGLPHSYVTAIRQNEEGYLLVGTDEGLARFDGVTFRPVAVDPALRLDKRWISALLIDRDASLWTATFDGMVVHLRQGAVESKFALGGSVFDLLRDRAGNLWAGSRDGFWRLESGQMRRVPGLGAPHETSWNLLAEDAGGTVWAVTAAGLFRVSASTRPVLVLPSGGPPGDILTARPAPGGNLWVGTTTGLFLLPPNQPASALRRVAGIEGPAVALLQDRDNVLWAGTWGRGLYRVHSGVVQRWAARDGLPEDFVRTLSEDSEGSLWIGMRSGGLGRWKDARLVPFGPPEGLAGNYAATVALAPGGDLWFGTWRGGLYRLTAGRLENQPTPLPTLYFTIRAFAFDPRGQPWMGNWEGLFQFDGTRYRRYGGEPDTTYRRVSALLFDSQGALWVGSAERGLFRFPGGAPTNPIPPPLLPGTEITALLEDSSGNIWVGTAAGAGWFERGGPAAFHPLPDLPPETVESLFEDSRRRIWISTAEGSILVRTPSRTVLLGKPHGLPGHALYRVLEDDSGHFWVSSSKGILELPGEALEAVLEGRRTALTVLLHDVGDGMRTIECHGLSQPAGQRASDGTLWFPTAKGFVQVRRAQPRTGAPPRVSIEELRTDSGPLSIAGPVRLPPGSRNIEIQFTGLRLSSPRKVEFRYRLAGYDPDWVYAGTQRSARYNQLPPGDRSFSVQARDPSGDWSAPATLALNQQPRFHQTWWFLLLSGMTFLAGVFGLYRWRLHALRGRYAAVLEERNRIGREWHDTLVAGFSAISLQLEAARSKVGEQPGRASEILDITRKMVHHYRAEARRVIWDLRDSRPEGETLPGAMESALARVIEPRGIQGQVTVSGTPVDLPAEVQHNILRICQEAMSNAARHAEPTHIDIQLDYTSARLRAVVRDDGRGFSLAGAPAEHPGHFGLTVMQERAARLGGRLTIESQPGQGTRVEAEVPLPPAGADRR